METFLSKSMGLGWSRPNTRVCEVGGLVVGLPVVLVGMLSDWACVGSVVPALLWWLAHTAYTTASFDRANQ